MTREVRLWSNAFSYFRALPPLVHFPPRSASLALTPVHSRSLPRVRAWPNGDDHDLGHDQEHSADSARWTSFVLL